MQNIIYSIFCCIGFGTFSVISIMEGEWVCRGGVKVFTMKDNPTPFWIIQGILISGSLVMATFAISFYIKRKNQNNK